MIIVENPTNVEKWTKEDQQFAVNEDRNKMWFSSPFAATHKDWGIEFFL